MARTNSPIAAICLLLAASLHPGCAPEAPPARIGYHIDSPRALLRLNRVVLVPLVGRDEHAAIAEEMTDALFKSVQDKRLFHLQALDGVLGDAEQLPVPARRPCTLRELAAMRRILRCDAVLYGWITHFRPYPGMKMGLNLRLMDLKRKPCQPSSSRRMRWYRPLPANTERTAIRGRT